MYFLTFPVANLVRVRDIARNVITSGHRRELTGTTLLDEIKAEMAESEISSPREARDVLRALAFKFGNLHSDHYRRIAARADVQFHRKLFAPLLLSELKSPKTWVIHCDASFTNKNAHADMGWFSLDEEGDDLTQAGIGLGGRLNMFEFVTEDGILWHPDGSTSFQSKFAPFALSDVVVGKSAGTIFPPNSVQTDDDIVRAVQRGIEAIKADPRSKSHIPILSIDAATVNKTMEPDAIFPSNVRLMLSVYIILYAIRYLLTILQMNLSDGGKNRRPMRGIHLLGLRSVLESRGLWRDGMSLSEARRLMWQQRDVMAQKTRIEKICNEAGIIVHYQSKAHPDFNATEVSPYHNYY